MSQTKPVGIGNLIVSLKSGDKFRIRTDAAGFLDKLCETIRVFTQISDDQPVHHPDDGDRFVSCHPFLFNVDQIAAIYPEECLLPE